VIGQFPERQKAERNQKILEMRRSGKKLREIAEHYGIRPETVRQIVVRQKVIEKNGLAWKPGSSSAERSSAADGKTEPAKSDHVDAFEGRKEDTAE